MPQKTDAHPPTDDAELLLGIRRFIAEAADTPIETVDPEVNIYEALKVDSLGATCIFIDISYEYGIEEPEDEAMFVELDTAQKIFQWVRAREAALA